MSTRLAFSSPTSLPSADTLVVIGRADRLAASDVVESLPGPVAKVWSAMLASVSAGDAGGNTTTWVEGTPSRVVVGVLPEPCSRHNSPARPHAVTSLVGKAPGKGDVAVLLAVDEAEHAFAAGCAAARAFPEYSTKSKGPKNDRVVTMAALAPSGPVDVPARLPHAAEGIRLAQNLLDQPTSVLHTKAFADHAQSLAEELGATVLRIEDDALDAKGFGGLFGVGKAAVHGPALVILTHDPEGAEETLAWVGKGIVYDTGGLSIKGKGGMPGMKGDMGGAAAVLGAFVAAVKSGAKQRIHALLCLAENSVAANATRPDDILDMYSGKTVEVNNTDAEGRLVLADGVAYASKHLSPDVICDLATLTGAQLLSTGKRHAAIVCSDEALEGRAVVAGRSSGDLVHPLPYVPEFFRKEFRSVVADMKNSVKDRMNAQASCAGQFVAEHLVDFEGAWLHIDLAGPSSAEERGTGYGVALLLDLFLPE
jgi:probable aminopeptidase NPEPL1